MTAISMLAAVSLIESTPAPHSEVGLSVLARMSAKKVPGEPPFLASEADRLRLARMFTVHHATVWRLLRRRGLPEDEAADATQETFLVAAGRLADIPEGSERAFLIGTARRVAHTLGRKTFRWQLDEDMDQRVSTARDTGDERADLQLCDIALSKMNPELAEAFVLYELEGLSCTEIAALLEIPLGSVASRLRRARDQFRDTVMRIERSLQRFKGSP
jgi:RNA polymerase sigma-70 factor, ECF subfamily